MKTVDQWFEEYGESHQNRTNKAIHWLCIPLIMFSLIGLPPFGGFFAKWMVFYSVVQAANIHWFMWVVLAVAGLNTVYSLFYYLRPLKAVFISEKPDGSRPVRIGTHSRLYVATLSVFVILLGVSPWLAEGLSSRAQDVAAALLAR